MPRLCCCPPPEDSQWPRFAVLVGIVGGETTPLLKLLHEDPFLPTRKGLPTPSPAPAAGEHAASQPLIRSFVRFVPTRPPARMTRGGAVAVPLPIGSFSKARREERRAAAEAAASAVEGRATLARQLLPDYKVRVLPRPESPKFLTTEVPVLSYYANFLSIAERN